MSECRKHPKIFTIKMLRDNGEYSDWCPACREWCDECSERSGPTSNLQPQNHILNKIKATSEE